MRSDRIAEDQQKSRQRGRRGSPHTPPSPPPAAASRSRGSPKQWKHDKFTDGSPVRPHDFDREAENRKR